MRCRAQPTVGGAASGAVPLQGAQAWRGVARVCCNPTGAAAAVPSADLPSAHLVCAWHTGSTASSKQASARSGALERRRRGAQPPLGTGPAEGRGVMSGRSLDEMCVKSQAAQRRRELECARYGCAQVTVQGMRAGLVVRA